MRLDASCLAKPNRVCDYEPRRVMSPEIDPPSHHHTVFVIDDSDDLREGFEVLLAHHGIRMIGASTGTDALAQFRAGLRPCLVLLDLRMPDVDGMAVLQQMHADRALAGIGVVVISGDTGRRGAAELGVREVLTKPIYPDQLLDIIERHCQAA